MMVKKIKQIQTIIFDGRVYNKRAVKEWIRKSGFCFMKYKSDPIDTEKRVCSQGKYKEYRVRQRMPSKFIMKSLVTGYLIKCPNSLKPKKHKGIKAVFGYLK